MSAIYIYVVKRQISAFIQLFTYLEPELFSLLPQGTCNVMKEEGKEVLCVYFKGGRDFLSHKKASHSDIKRQIDCNISTSPVFIIVAGKI